MRRPQQLRVQLPQRPLAASTEEIRPDHVNARQLVVAPPPKSADLLPGLSLEICLLRDFWVAEVRIRMQELTSVPSDYGADVVTTWDGGRNRFGRRDKSAWWPELLNSCRDRQVSPYKFLRFMLRNWTGTAPPSPSFVVCDQAFAMFLASPSDHELFELEFKLQKTHAKSVFENLQRDRSYSSDSARWVSIIYDRKPPLTPLFRCSLAYAVGLTEVAVKLLPAAAKQYRRDRDLYDRVWAAHVPAVLKTMDGNGLARKSLEAGYV